jgi:two-component system copper resistance phosphate regulon response regulator CusR
MKILLVESETHSAQYLRKGLVENGFAVDVMDTDTAGPAPRRTEYDLMVCDLPAEKTRLPLIRREGEPPLLLLANRNTELQRLGESGCEEYLLKPFAFSDFLARVRQLLSSGRDRFPMTLRIGGLELDLVRHRAARDGNRLDLTPKEFLLLSLLMRRAGTVLSRTFLADQVWDINFESNTNFVEVHIRRLRSKVDDPFLKKLIHTMRGVGYVLEER